MNVQLAFFEPGFGQIILILCIVLIFFGSKKIPELAKGLGQGIKEFKKATRDVTDEVHNAMNDRNDPPATPPLQRQIPTVAPVEPPKTVAQGNPGQNA